jgi:ribosomal protein S18 acetylase RimI-like enzyme
MLVEAAAWRPGDTRSAEEILADPANSVYVDEWGRVGDVGLMAEDDGGEGLGAGWYRVFTDWDHGYGYVEASVPELTLAVKRGARGQGVGTALLSALVERARADDVPGLSLSVEQDNPARRLYERVGFRQVGRDGNAWTMRLDLS